MARPGVIRRVLVHRNAQVFFAGSLLSWTGMWMQRVAVGWLAWELTNSAFWVGALAFCNLIPSVVTSPIAGAAADRLDRIRLTMLTQVITATQATVLAVLVLTKWVSIELMLVLEIILGIAQAFAQPARQAIVPALTPRADLPSAVALNSITFNIARFIGPAVAGPMIVIWGTAPVMLTNAAAYLLASITLPMLALTPDQRRGHAPTGSLWGETVEGFTYVARHVGIGGLFLYAALLAVLVRAVPEMLPPFVDLLFQRGATGLAILTGVMGGAAFLGGFLIASRASLRGQSAWAVHAGLVMVLATAGFAATKSFAFATVSIALLGAATTVHGIAVQSLTQYSASPAMIGRVLSVWGMIVRAFPALGALAFGALSEAFGLQVPVLAACGIGLVVWVWAWRNLTRFAQSVEPKE